MVAHSYVSRLQKCFQALVIYKEQMERNVDAVLEVYAIIEKQCRKPQENSRHDVSEDNLPSKSAFCFQNACPVFQIKRCIKLKFFRRWLWIRRCVDTKYAEGA